MKIIKYFLCLTIVRFNRRGSVHGIESSDEDDDGPGFGAKRQRHSSRDSNESSRSAPKVYLSYRVFCLTPFLSQNDVLFMIPMSLTLIRIKTPMIIRTQMTLKSQLNPIRIRKIFSKLPLDINNCSEPLSCNLMFLISIEWRQKLRKSRILRSF